MANYKADTQGVVTQQQIELIAVLQNQARNMAEEIAGLKEAVEHYSGKYASAEKELDHYRQTHPAEPVPQQDDPVNNPKHYQFAPGIEAIDVIEAILTTEQFRGYCIGNALKYRLRAGDKGDTQQDIDKSKWYQNRARSL